MYVIKENKLILQGTRNRLDGLWGIPVSKTKISGNNFKKPKTNVAIYIKKGSRTSNGNTMTKNNHTSHVLKKLSPNTLCNELQES